MYCVGFTVLDLESTVAVYVAGVVVDNLEADATDIVVVAVVRSVLLTVAIEVEVAGIVKVVDAAEANEVVVTVGIVDASSVVVDDRRVAEDVDIFDK